LWGLYAANFDHLEFLISTLCVGVWGVLVG
jgi:hypothetical protein